MSEMVTGSGDNLVQKKTKEEGSITESDDKECCCFGGFQNQPAAKGIFFLSAGRGAFLTAFVFLSPSFLFLASEQAGCVDEQTREIFDDCSIRVYGFLPSSILTNIVTIGGIVSAFLMPLVGAIIDYTSYRRRIGITACIFIVIIQVAQIGTVSSTWFPMAIIASFQEFFNEVLFCSYMAYMPEMARCIGEGTMAKHASKFLTSLYSSMVMFLVVITIIGRITKLNEVDLAHISQGVNAVYIGVAFFIGWRYMPTVPAKRVLPENESVLKMGFVQIWNTGKNINKNYKGLRCFLLSNMFGDSGFTATPVIAVSYMLDQMKMTGSEIGIMFIICLLATIPGAHFGSYFSVKMDPPTSLKAASIVFIIVTNIGTIFLNPERSYISYILGFLWGAVVGWYFATQHLFFSMCMPKGQETEIAGFFIYSSRIISWLPTLAYTLVNESGVDQKWGLMGVNVFVFISFIFLFFLSPWDTVLAEVQSDVTKTDGDDERNTNIQYDETPVRNDEENGGGKS